jgi:hypothetical protein
MPIFPYLVLALYLAIGVISILAALLSLRRWKRRISKQPFPLEKIQLAIWGILVAVGIALCATHNLPVGMFLILLAQFLPRGSKGIARESNNNIYTECKFHLSYREE